jgi:hypothetical protein
LIDDRGVEQVISANKPEWLPVFTGLSIRQFSKLVRIVTARCGEQTGTGRRWGLPLAIRVLLVAVYYRTNRATVMTAEHSAIPTWTSSTRARR